MKKAILICVLFILSVFCFAESQKEIYTKMVTTFCEKGSCVIFKIPKQNANEIPKQNAVVPKTAILTIRLYDDSMQILYMAGDSWNTVDYSSCNIYLDKNNNLVISIE